MSSPNYSTTSSEERSFAEYMLSDIGQLLDEILVWVGDNLGPENVFEEDDLVAWAKESGREPQDFFSEDDLRDWALSHGFVEAE